MTVTEIRPRSAEDVTRDAAQQLGFAWHCTKSGTEGECDEAGNDRAEYAAHMKGHGLRSPRPVKMIKLKRTPPGATLGKLEIPVAKWVHWDDMHTERGVCQCGHEGESHKMTQDGGNLCEGCGWCTRAAWNIAPRVTTQRRRGQFWALGTGAHTFWILPFEPAPWETGRAQPVQVHVSQFIR
jgi:hypothetical protein